MWKSMMSSLTMEEDWVLGLRPMIHPIPSKLGRLTLMWVSLQQPRTYLESGKYLSLRSSHVQDYSMMETQKSGGNHLEELSNQSLSPKVNLQKNKKAKMDSQDISEIADKIKLNSIGKLLWCLSEPHGIDTRVTLTTEECHALLAMLDPRTVLNASSKRSLIATNTLPKFAGVYYMQEAVARGIKRVSHVRHIQQGDIRSRHF